VAFHTWEKETSKSNFNVENSNLPTKLRGKTKEINPSSPLF